MLILSGTYYIPFIGKFSNSKHIYSIKKEMFYSCESCNILTEQIISVLIFLCPTTSIIVLIALKRCLNCRSGKFVLFSKHTHTHIL